MMTTLTTARDAQLDVVTLGEAMAMFVAAQTGDLAAVESFTKRIAGAELNVAIGLARLGLNVGWVSRVATTRLAALPCNS